MTNNKQTSKKIKLNKDQFALYSALYDKAISRKYDLLSIVDNEIDSLIKKYYKQTTYDNKKEIEFLMYSVARRLYEIGVSRGVIMAVDSIEELKNKQNNND